MSRALLKLKADLHTHSADDPRDPIAYSSEMLIDAAARLRFDVLALACHCKCVQNARLEEYARRRSVLLIPAAELLVDGKHVVVLNPDDAQAAATTFDQLRVLGRRDAAIMAPHPFYPEKRCLGKKLLENIDLFDAIEYCSMYYYGLNPNGRAVREARRFGLPLVGTSDAHTMPYRDSTFSWLEADEVSVAGVIGAIRAGRVSVETRPRSLGETMVTGLFLARERLRVTLGLRD